jgi:hypothetical protein
MIRLLKSFWFDLVAAVLLVVFAFVAIETAHAAEKAPPCWPKQLAGSGSSYKTGATEDGRWLAWVCVVSGKKETYGVWAVKAYEVKHPDVTGLTPAAAANAYWALNVGATDTAPLQRLRAAAAKAFS